MLSPDEEDLLFSLRQLDGPVLTVFWKPNHAPSQDVIAWARGCKALAGDTFALVTLESSRYPQLARWWRVSDVPAVLVLVRGEVADHLEGDYYRFHHWITGAAGW